MNGSDLRDWRKRHGYNQEDLLKELGVRSRQTLSSWENSDESLPRMLELALIALAEVPKCRNIYGKRATADDRRRARGAGNLESMRHVCASNEPPEVEQEHSKNE